MTRKNSDKHDLFAIQSPDGSQLITVKFKPDADATSLARCYSHVSQTCRAMGLKVAQERCWGDLDFMGTHLIKARNDVIHDAVAPVLLEGSAARGGPIAGIQIRAVPENSATAITCDNQITGMQWTHNGDRFAILSGICGPGENSSSETLTLLQKVNTIVSMSGFEVSDIARTWFYLDHILDWYDDFNAVRTKVYDSWGLTNNDGSGQLHLPASTGIGVQNGFSKALTADVLIVKRTKGPVTQLSNAGQKDAFKYGSAFSRGALLPFDAGTLLELSGTASINEAGDSVFKNDARAQIQCTIQKIDALLNPLDISIRDLATGVAFFRNACDVQQFDDHCAKLGLHPHALPIICVQADVCRDDLLFEMDGELVTKSVATPLG